MRGASKPFGKQVAVAHIFLRSSNCEKKPFFFPLFFYSNLYTYAHGHIFIHNFVRSKRKQIKIREEKKIKHLNKNEKSI